MPRADEDKAKSLILSTAYEIDGEYRGRSSEELMAIAKDIREGKPYEFKPLEVQMVIMYARRVLGVPPRRLVIDGLKWIVPPVAILLLVYLAIAIGAKK